jgi:diguanylate cyclase (GGDEF)-like protein
VILDALREAIAPAATGDGEAEPQQGAQQPDPGAELRRLAQQYSGKSDGLVEKGNVDLTNRPRVTNPDRSTSTVRSMSFEQDGREILVPTVSDDGRIMSNDEAIQQYRKTGKHLGIFRDVASANAYAKSLHEQQAGTLSDSTDPGAALRKLAVQSMLRPEVPAAQAPSVSRQPPVTEPGPFAGENAKAFDQTPAPTPEEPKPGILSRIKKTIADALSEQPDQGYGAEARPTAPTRTGLRAPGKPAPETTAAQELGLNEKGLTGRVVNALGDAAANPIKTAAGLAWAPVKAAITLDKASAELETRNTIAQAGGDPNSVEMTVTPKEAAIAAAQLGSLALGPEFEALLGRVAAPFIGTVANVAGSRAAAVAGRAAAIGTRGAVGAGAGAVFSPDDPAVGAILGGAAGAAHAAASGAAVEPRRIALQEPEGANLADHPDRLLASRERPKPSATARAEPEAAAPGGDESPFTVESTNTPGEALAELARRYKKGTDVTPGAASEAPAPTPSGPLAALSEALRAARMKTAEVIAPELGAERRAANRAATTDAMTGLGNQRAYEGAVKAAEADPKTSVIRFDLNGFKNVNDVHGHEAGDAALKSVASVIREHAKGLPAFRVGGDEFALFAPAADAARVRDAIEQAIGVRTVHDATKTLNNLASGGKPAIAKYSISGGIGETNAAADADAIARKTEHKKAQGIAGRTEVAPSASSVRSEPVANIDVEPERFQYKLNTNEKGVGRELESVKKWNPDLAGVIGVWRDPVDGRLKVINGHHRLDLAQRNNIQNVDVREINAPDAKTARATGAIINIAEGRGTAVDAAKMFRDTQMSPADLEQRGVSLTGQVAKEGLALSKLHPKIFDDVVAGRMPVQRAAVIGNAGLEPEQQLALTNMLEQREAKGRKMPNDAIAELVRFVKEAGSESTTQESLFGEEQMTQSLAPEKAELSAWVKEKLGKDRRLFGFLTKGGRAEHIEGAGVGKIETQRAEALATDAAQAEEVYNKLSTMSGPISDALNHAAREWVRGGERGAIRTQLYEAVSNAVRASVGDAEGPRGGGVAPAPERHEATGESGAPDEGESLFGDIVSESAREPESGRQPPFDRVSKDVTTPSERSQAAARRDDRGRRTGEPAPGDRERGGGGLAGEGAVRPSEGVGGDGGSVRGELSRGDAEQLGAAEHFRREMEKRNRKVPDRRALHGPKRPTESPPDESRYDTEDDDLPLPPDHFAPATQRARLAKTTVVDDAGEPLVVYYHTSSPSDDPRLTRERLDYNALHLRRDRVPRQPDASGWTYEKARRAMIDSGRWSDAEIAKLEATLAGKQRYRPAYRGLEALTHILQREKQHNAGVHGFHFHPASWWKQFGGLVEPPPGLDRPLGIRLRAFDEVVDVRDFGGNVMKHAVHVNIERPLRLPDGGATGWTYETVRHAMIQSGHWTDEQIAEWERAAGRYGVRAAGQQARVYGIDALRALIKRPSADRFGARFGGHPKGFDGIVFRNIDGAPGSAPLQIAEDEALRRWAAQSEDERLGQYYRDARDHRVAHQQKYAVDSWVALDDEQVFPAVPLGQRPEAAPAKPYEPQVRGRRKMTDEQKAAWKHQREQRIALGEELPRLGRPKRVQERDLFGEEIPERKKGAQESMFGEKAGTEASRSLQQTERAAHAELEDLKKREAMTTSPVERVKLARRIADLEKLVNRDKSISAEELRHRAAGQNDIFSEVRTDKSRAGMGVNRERLADTMSANVYSGGLAKVIVKEAIQNAIDAVRPTGGGTIKVKLDDKARTITVSDNGVGMSPETATGAFLDAFESEKPEGASGGLGIAKAALFRYAEPFRTVTVAEVPDTDARRGMFNRSKAMKKVQTTIEGSGRDWVRGDLSVHEEDVPDDTPTGTEYSITIDKQLQPDDVSFFAAREFLHQLQRNSRLDDVHFEITDSGEYPAEARDPEVPTKPRAVVDVPGARVEIFLSDGPIGFSFGQYTSAHILNNGYHQFTDSVRFGPNPPEIWIDVHPTVPVTDPSYPFTIDRSKLKDATKMAIEKAIEPLSRAKEARHLDELIRAIAEAPDVKGGGKVIATEPSVTAELAEKIAARPYTRDIVAWWKAAGQAIHGALVRAREMPEPNFAGVGLGGSYLAVNIQVGRLAERARKLGIDIGGDTRNVLLINPFNLVLEARANAGIFADDAEYLADQTWGALVHEIAHQRARGHDENFSSEYTRIDGRAARVQAQHLAELDRLWHRLLDDDSFQEDIEALRQSWKTRSNRFEGFYGHDQFARGDAPDEASQAVSRLARDSDDAGDDVRASSRPARGRASPPVSGGGPVPGGGGGSSAQPGARGAGVSGAHAGGAGPAVAGGARRAHPMPEPTGTGIRQSNFRPFDLVRKIKSVFIPEALGPDARGAAGTIRHEGAQRFRAYTQAAEALRELRAHIEKLPRDRQVEVWDDYENGRDTGDAFIDGANKVFRQVTEERTNELIRLDRLRAERAIINYIGRFWSIENGPKKAANLLRTIFGKRPFEGPKSFLKQRSLEHFVEGLDAGLVPATYNYVESQLAKIAEMERLIGAEHMLQAEQKQGRAKPILNGHDVPEDADGEKWVKIDREGNDPAFTIWGPPEVTHWEGVDAMVYGKLQKLIQDLRIRHERKLKIGQGLGYARRAPEEMVTKFGGPEGTIMHELGHILDFRYNFKRLLAEGIGKAPTRTVKKGKRVGAAVPDYKNESPQARARRKQLREELRNLANLRRETLAGVPDTKNLSKADRAYLHSWPEKAANMVEAYIGARDRFRQVAPGIFEIFDAIVEDHPELHPLRDIRPSLSRETHAVVERLPGPVVAGHWYAPRNAAAVWQNHLSKGMRGNPIYDAVTAPGVAATQILLGISGFHGTVIATEGMFSDMVLAAEQLLSGKPLASAKALGRVVGSPVTSAISSLPFRAKRQAALAFGAKVMQEYRKPGSHPELATVLEAMIAGGFRGTEKSEMWTGERADALKRAFRQALHNDSKVLRAWNASKIPLNAIYAGIELLSAPLMSRYVPLMKTAASYHAVAKRLDELPPNLADERRHDEMWDIVKEMDYRFGQVIYDNHFINAVAKHLAQAMFMAPGWTFGTLALMARGVRDVAVAPKRIYDRATGKPGAKERPILGRSGKYWVAAVVGTMLLNGLLTYFNTGTMPGDGEDGDWWKDFFAFRDGTYDINGNANRHTIPGYLMHDVYGWTHHQYDTFLNKLNPFFSFAASVVRNQGRFGEMIRDPDGSPAEQARDVGAAAVKNFSPLSVQNYLEGRDREETGASELTRNAFGVNPAKREVVRSDAQNRMAEYLSRRGRSTPTPDEAEARTDRARILSGARVGADVSDRITTAIERGELTVPQLTRLMKRVGILPLQEQFKSLTIKQALDVFDRATPREQGLLLDILQKKIANSGRAP